MDGNLQLQVEGISQCNARCFWCVYPTLDRPRGIMPMSLYGKIIEEAAAIPQITCVVITGLSESLLDKYLDQRIALTKKLLPSALIVVYTNGSFLNPARFETLKAAGVGSVVVSLNAVSAEGRKKTMALDDYDAVCEYIQYAIDHREGVRIAVRTVLDQDIFTQKDIAPFYRRWGHAKVGGYGEVINEGNWAGETRTTRPLDPNSCCDRAIGSIYVDWQGKVTPCCFVPDSRVLCFGDLKENTLKEIYNSPEYVAFRTAHAEERAAVYSVCSTCTRI